MKTSMETSLAPFLALLVLILVQIGLSDAAKKCYVCDATWVDMGDGDNKKEAEESEVMAQMKRSSAIKEDDCFNPKDAKPDKLASQSCDHGCTKKSVKAIYKNDKGITVHTKSVQRGCVPKEIKDHKCEDEKKSEDDMNMEDWTAKLDGDAKLCNCNDKDLCNGVGRVRPALATVVVTIMASLFY